MTSAKRSAELLLKVHGQRMARRAVDAAVERHEKYVEAMGGKKAERDLKFWKEVHRLVWEFEE